MSQKSKLYKKLSLKRTLSFSIPLRQELVSFLFILPMFLFEKKKANKYVCYVLSIAFVLKNYLGD